MHMSHGSETEELLPLFGWPLSPSIRKTSDRDSFQAVRTIASGGDDGASPATAASESLTIMSSNNARTTGETAPVTTSMT
jgi:hypothetical protein